MTALSIEAPARLHLGMVDLDGSLGRRFGGVGVAVSRPALALEARSADELRVEGEDSEAALVFAKRYLAAVGVRGGGLLRITGAIPRHLGFGSGTRLALCVATGLASLHGQSTDPGLLARAVGRAQRSAVGLWTFARGGLVVEGGRRVDGDAPAPLLVRHAVPPQWRCVLAIPDGMRGLTGGGEAAAFENRALDGSSAAHIAHLILMSLLPALVEGDIREFGGALTRLQQLVGDCFRPVQGGRYSHPLVATLVEAMLSWGAAGAGQSSWGPTVFGLAADEQHGRDLERRACRLLDGRGRVEIVRFDNRGVRCRRLQLARVAAR